MPPRKCLTRCSARRRGVTAAASQRRPPAGGEVSCLYFNQGRSFLQTSIHCERTARVEAAAGRHRGSIGHATFDRAEPLLLEVEARDRAEQADGVRVMWLG